MAIGTTLEKGLERLLGLCPDITLDTKAIKLLIDGDINRVIGEYKGTWKEPEIVDEHTCDDKCGHESPVEDEDETNASIAIDTDDKSFNDYF